MALSVLRRAGYRHELLFDSTKRRARGPRALTHKPDGAQFPHPFYQAEFERVILPQGCESVDDYLRASRVGRGRRLSRPSS